MSARVELEALYARDGFLTPEQVVEYASDPASPLHSQFVWDDTEAARRYRLHQAGLLIRRCKVTVDISAEETRRVRAFVSVPKGDDDREYVPLMEAMSDNRRDVVVQQAAREVAALRRKYRALIDIDSVIREAISEVPEEATA